MDDLLIGAFPVDESDVAMLEFLGVQRVLNLVEDDEYRPGDREAAEQALADAGIEEWRLALPDYGGLPPGVLESSVQLVSDWMDAGLRVYIHCRAGWQRSATVAAGVVALREGIDVGQALAQVQARKPSADPLPHQREDLQRWWDGRGGSGPSDGDAKAAER